MSGLTPFQLLEINLISAQDLAKASRSMKSYAMAWVHPDRKLTTRVDTHGKTNPTWNDKFIFRVDNQFLQSDTSAIMIEIYALHWFRDTLVGTVRVLVSNLIPPRTKSHNNGQNHIGMRFVALQVRRPSGRPQGIINVGVTLLDGTMRSMPLYTQLSTSAVGYETLMGVRKTGASTIKDSTAAQLRLRRTMSDKSSMVNDNEVLQKPKSSTNGGSDSGRKKKSKVIYDKPLSVVDGSTSSSDLSKAIKLKAQEGKAESVVSYGSSTKRGGKRPIRKTPSILTRSDVGSKKDLTLMSRSKNNGGSKRVVNDNINNKPYFRGYPIAKDFAAGSVWSESEVGPSPSEVAAAIAEDSKYRQYDDGRSSMLDDKWSMDEESEGVRTKLERWRREMPPPAYDHSRTTNSSSSSTIFRRPKHSRRNTEGTGGGKFSCFGNICGYECSIVCGAGDGGGTGNKKKKKVVARPPPSIDSVSTYF